MKITVSWDIAHVVSFMLAGVSEVNNAVSTPETPVYFNETTLRCVYRKAVTLKPSNKIFGS
jgi:hypothetical protein